MKKSVVIIIALIYVASIALVSFFGLAFNVFEEIVYVNAIEILNDDVEQIEGVDYCDCFVVIEPDENGIIKYQIEYRVYPDKATNKGVNFVYDEQTAAAEGITVDEYGVVTFSKTGTSITIKLIPKDGSDVSSLRLAIFAA